jgi:hypothetical protein
LHWAEGGRPGREEGPASASFATARDAPYRRRMIRIAITPAAFEAIAATLPLGNVGHENDVNEKGELGNGSI